MSVRALVVALVSAVVVAACVVAIDPDTERFSCGAQADCGEGWACRPYFFSADGGGRCFVAGACVDTEVCNRTDDTCDGRTDETFPTEDAGCDSGQPGECRDGAQTCVDGGIFCRARKLSAPERCNLLDDDCDGTTDEDFDLQRDGENCGRCGARCDGGTSCQSGACGETTCDDRVDNDVDGAADCLDEGCRGRSCGGAARCGGPSDGGVSDGGPPRCYAPETTCDDGLDDDVDGLTDCGDPDCNGLRCSSGNTCTALMCP